MQLTLLKLPKNFLSPPLYLCGDRNSLGLYLCRSNIMENWISFLDHPVEKSFCLFQGSLGTEASVTPLLVDRECHVALPKTKAEKKFLLIKEKACLSLRLCPNKWKDWRLKLWFELSYWLFRGKVGKSLGFSDGSYFWSLVFLHKSRNGR